MPRTRRTYPVRSCRECLRPVQVDHLEDGYCSSCFDDHNLLAEAIALAVAVERAGGTSWLSFTAPDRCPSCRATVPVIDRDGPAVRCARCIRTAS